MDGAEQLIPSDRGITGYKGVHPGRGRYQATCTTPPCHKNYLGTFGTLELAAQVYLQHHQKEHPEELKKERAPPLQVQEHLLIRSDRSSTWLQGGGCTVWPVPGSMHHTTLPSQLLRLF
jgi:hypothetical protein